MLLTSTKKIIERFRLSQGGLIGSILDIRVLIKRALDRMAAGIILVHNHPSGSAMPSQEGDLNTKRAKQAANFFDIRLLDHVIITDGECYSFAEQNML